MIDLDIVFLIDSTESMTDYWQFALDNWLPKLVVSAPTTLETAKGLPFDIRYACVTYNDYMEGLTPDVNLEDTGCVICPFTRDIQKFLCQIETGVFIYGGGDSPEDLVGGLHKVEELEWRPGSKRLLYIMTDAPCHGVDFHHTVDAYPAGDPKGRKPLDILRKLATMKIVCIFMRCGKLIDPMIEVFLSYDINYNLYLLETGDWILPENAGLAIDIFQWTLCYMVRIPQTLKMQCIALVHKHEFFNGLVVQQSYLPQELVELLVTSAICFEQSQQHQVDKDRSKKKKHRLRTIIGRFKKKMRI